MSHRTQAQIDLNFTKEQGIAIQQKQLKELKCVLMLSPYEHLEKLVMQDNDKAIDGFDITRGDTMFGILVKDVFPVFYHE